jgi:hypothetical protein
MLCERCHGRRVEVVGGAPRPCPACVGAGLVDCCDGPPAQCDFATGSAAGLAMPPAVFEDVLPPDPPPADR